MANDPMLLLPAPNETSHPEIKARRPRGVGLPNRAQTPKVIKLGPTSNWKLPEEIIPHRSFGPARLIDSAFDVPLHWAGSLGHGFVGGLLGGGVGEAIHDVMVDYNKVGFKLGNNRHWLQAASWIKKQHPVGIGTIAEEAFEAGMKGAKTHFAPHSPFAWTASGVQLGGKTAGGTIMRATGQIAGEAVRGLAVGAAWVGATVLSGALRAIPKFGGDIIRLLEKGAATAPSKAKAAEAIMESFTGGLSKVVTSAFEKLPRGTKPRSVIEALTGHRLNKQVEGTIGRSLAYGLPLAAFGWGALTMKGQIETAPLANRQLAGVMGSAYAAQAGPGPNNLGATGDLVMALHGLR